MPAAPSLEGAMARCYYTMIPTQRQREAIESWQRGDVCVVAGPGSGKTYVLVERFRWLVEVQKVPVWRILAITFTDQAAANMRRRLVETFPAASERRQALERAYISTIHAFCARLLKENALEAAVDPEFRVLDEWEADFELREAIEEALEQEYRARPEEARRFLAAFGSNDPHGSLFQLYDAMRAAGAGVEEAGRLPSMPSAAERWQALAGAYQQVRELPTTGWRLDHREALAEILKTGPAARPEINLNKVKRGSRQSALLKRIREELAPAFRAARLLEQTLSSRLWFLDGLARAERLYQDRKQKAGALDFSDLEERAIRLLEGAGARLCSSFSYILMDEFQDTNRLQARLVGLLRGHGNFFAVGDINQSIYGFRHADPTVFRDFRDQTVQSGGHAVPLFENFRSRQEVLDQIQKIMQQAEGIEAQDLRAGSRFDPAPGPCLEVFWVRAEEGEEALEREALGVAARVRKMAGTHPLQTGPAGYGDMAVLLRTSNQVRVFERALREQGIPCQVTEGRGYYDTREIADLLAFLRAILNPLDEISLAAALRSPLGGVTDDTLWRLKLDGRPLSDGLRQPPAMPEAEAEALGRFARLFRRYQEDRDTLALDRLLGRLLAETGYEAWLAGQPGGGHRVANVRKLLALARRFHAGGLWGIQGFVDRVEDLRRDQAREAEARPPEQTPDAVQLMTVHAAKGLEFPIVFLPATNRAGRPEREPVRFLPGIGVGIRWRNPQTGKDEPDAVAEAVAAEARASRREENQRLFYVAMTRAKELLILSASFWATGRAEQWAANLERNLGINFQLPHPADDQPVAAGPARRPAERGVERQPQQATLPEALDQADASVAATSVALFVQCPRRYYLSSYLGFGRSRPRLDLQEEEREPPEPDQMDATEFGSLVHELLAGVRPREDTDPRALELVTNFESSEWGRRAARAERVEREQRFLLALDERLLSGQIDLWFQEGGETVVIDYKTDQVTPQQAVTPPPHYQCQLRLYVLAVERLAGARPDRAILYYLRPNVAAEVSFEADQLSEARARVEELYQSQSRLDFPLRPGGHCHSCPHFGGLCPVAVDSRQ